MRAILIVVEGVLRKLTDGTPIREGIELVTNFTGERDALVFLTEHRVIRTAEWLSRQGVRNDLVAAKHGQRVQQLRSISLDYGYHFDLVVEPDPDICADLVANGYTTLGFFHPHYSKAEWRPDYKPVVKPWSELSTQVADAAALRAMETKE